MRVHDDILRCVAFLCVEVEPGLWKYGGTGFHIGVPSKSHPHVVYVYFVTARHNVQFGSKHGPLHIRLNLKAGGTRMFGIEAPWLMDDDPSVDVAMVPVSITAAGADSVYIPLEMLASDDVMQAEGVGVGDDLIVVGLFAPREGKQRNLPIVRQGILAAMPEEPLFDKNTGQKYDAFLGEVRSVGGLSGSPVFVFLSPGRVDPVTRAIAMRSKAYLLGLIRGHWEQPAALSDFADELQGNERDVAHMGIAAITPISPIIKLLNSDSEVARRTRLDRVVNAVAGIQLGASTEGIAAADPDWSG